MEEATMKSRILTCITAMTLFAALALPLQMAAQKHHRYKLIEFGTSANNAERGTNGAPNLNAGGTIAGAFATSDPTTPTSNPLACNGSSFVIHSFEWHDGIFTRLRSLPPSDTDCGIPFGLNASAEVVGVSENGELDPLTGFNQSRAVLWKRGKIIDLGSFGGNQNAALAINDGGQIAGNSLDTAPDPYSLVDFLLGSSNGTQTRGFLWQHGEMQDIGTLGGNDTNAGLINETGQIAGFSYTNTTANSTGIPTVDPFLWDKEKGMQDLGTLGGVFGVPTWLNNRGQVIGQSDLAGDLDSHPFLWTQGRLFDLDTITTGAQPIFADAIDDAGEIIGAAAFPNAPYDAYLWRDGVATDLGHVNGDCFSEAFGVNSRGQIVGNSLVCDGSFSNAFLWENGELVDLNTLVPLNSPHLIFAIGINERGEISAGDANGVVLLVPISRDDGAANPASVNDSATTTQRTPTPSDVAAMRARWWHSHRIPRGWK
jgi:probable HAF family extracellular repeat protein